MELPFNKDFMTARDLKTAADTLEAILRQFDLQLNADGKENWTPEQAEEFALRVLQVRSNFTLRK